MTDDHRRDPQQRAIPLHNFYHTRDVSRNSRKLISKCNDMLSRKSSAFAATVAAQNAGREAMLVGMKECEVTLSGPGAGRESAVRGLMSAGLSVTTIRDKTPVPHNGCRARKRRRV